MRNQPSKFEVPIDYERHGDAAYEHGILHVTSMAQPRAGVTLSDARLVAAA